MSLLVVTVKKARLQARAQDESFHAYVTVKLQNVKSTTVPVSGTLPTWEQEFIFELSPTSHEGIVVELWNKGVLWDRLLGVSFVPLAEIDYNEMEGPGRRWLQVDQELEVKNGTTVGTRNPTGHSVLVDLRFELPFDAQKLPEAEREEVKTRLCQLNRAFSNGVANAIGANNDNGNYYDQQVAEAIYHHHHHDEFLLHDDDATTNGGYGVGSGRRAPPLSHSGQMLVRSEDSDYIGSDIGTQLQQQHLANHSAHQYDSYLHPNRMHANGNSSNHHHHYDSSRNTDHTAVPRATHASLPNGSPPGMFMGGNRREMTMGEMQEEGGPDAEVPEEPDFYPPPPPPPPYYRQSSYGEEEEEEEGDEDEGEPELPYAVGKSQSQPYILSIPVVPDAHHHYDHTAAVAADGTESYGGTMTCTESDGTYSSQRQQAQLSQPPSSIAIAYTAGGRGGGVGDDEQEWEESGAEGSGSIQPIGDEEQQAQYSSGGSNPRHPNKSLTTNSTRYYQQYPPQQRGETEEGGGYYNGPTVEDGEEAGGYVEEEPFDAQMSDYSLAERQQQDGTNEPWAGASGEAVGDGYGDGGGAEGQREESDEAYEARLVAAGRRYDSRPYPTEPMEFSPSSFYHQHVATDGYGRRTSGGAGGKQHNGIASRYSPELGHHPPGSLLEEPGTPTYEEYRHTPTRYMVGTDGGLVAATPTPTDHREDEEDDENRRHHHHHGYLPPAPSGYQNAAGEEGEYSRGEIGREEDEEELEPLSYNSRGPSETGFSASQMAPTRRVEFDEERRRSSRGGGEVEREWGATEGGDKSEAHGQEDQQQQHGKDYGELWKWAYREVCRIHGIQVGNFSQNGSDPLYLSE